jgi:hypothetical protein
MSIVDDVKIFQFANTWKLFLKGKVVDPNCIMNTSADIEEARVVDKKGKLFSNLFSSLKVILDCNDKPRVKGVLLGKHDNGVRQKKNFALVSVMDPKKTLTHTKNGHKIKIRENYVEIDGIPLDCEQIDLKVDTMDFVRLNITGLFASELDVEIDELVEKGTGDGRTQDSTN